MRFLHCPKRSQRGLLHLKISTLIVLYSRILVRSAVFRRYKIFPTTNTDGSEMGKWMFAKLVNSSTPLWTHHCVRVYTCAVSIQSVHIFHVIFSFFSQSQQSLFYNHHESIPFFRSKIYNCPIFLKYITHFPLNGIPLFSALLKRLLRWFTDRNVAQGILDFCDIDSAEQICLSPSEKRKFLRVFFSFSLARSHYWCTS